MYYSVLIPDISASSVMAQVQPYSVETFNAIYPWAMLTAGFLLGVIVIFIIPKIVGFIADHVIHK